MIVLVKSEQTQYNLDNFIKYFLFRAFLI